MIESGSLENINDGVKHGMMRLFHDLSNHTHQRPMAQLRSVIALGLSSSGIPSHNNGSRPVDEVIIARSMSLTFSHIRFIDE